MSYVNDSQRMVCVLNAFREFKAVLLKVMGLNECQLFKVKEWQNRPFNIKPNQK